MQYPSGQGRRYTLDNLMNINGLSVAEIRQPHRVARVLGEPRVYVFRINDRQHHGEFHEPLFTTNIFVGNILAALIDPSEVATWSFRSRSDVPFYKWRLFEKLIGCEIVEEVVPRRGEDGKGRYELTLNRGRRFAHLDLVGYSATARLPGIQFSGDFADLCRALEGPQWCKLEHTAEYELLAR